MSLHIFGCSLSRSIHVFLHICMCLYIHGTIFGNERKHRSQEFHLFREALIRLKKPDIFIAEEYNERDGKLNQSTGKVGNEQA